MATEDRIADTLRALARPESPAPSPSGKLRVASLFWGRDLLVDAAQAVGLEISHSHADGDPEGPRDFDKVPAFDLIMASLPDGAEARHEALRLVMAYLYVRRPLAFLLASGDAGSMAEGLEESLEFARNRLRRMDYQTLLFGLPARGSAHIDRTSVAAFALGALGPEMGRDEALAHWPALDASAPSEGTPDADPVAFALASWLSRMAGA